MTGPVTPAAIAWLARSRTTTLQEAADLIQNYADEYAAAQVITALARQNAARRLMVELPLVRVS